jgi:hypothetical protein
MLNCRNAECRVALYAECHYVECRGATQGAKASRAFVAAVVDDDATNFANVNGTLFFKCSQIIKALLLLVMC